MAVPAEAAHVESPPESATTLRTVVDLVRRIMQADVASIVSFSFVDETITWRAISGFCSHELEDLHPFVHPQASEIVKQALAEKTVGILEGIGTGEFSAAQFPVSMAEGVSVLAMAPLRVQAGHSGALIAGYRSAHQFTDDEKRILLDLAEMAAVSLTHSQLVDTVSAAEKIWEQTFDAIREGIIVHDKEGRIIRSNALAAEMLNLQPGEVAGLSFNEAFARLFGRRAAAFHLKEGRDANSSFEVQTEDRRYIVSTFPINRPDGESFSVVTWNDLTRMSEMQEQLGRTRRLASVGQLAAGVAHEINNPLAAITTCAEATMRDLRQTPEVESVADSHQWTYYMEEIVRQALRCKEITRGLLDLTHQKQARRQMCDINAVAAQCAKVLVQGDDCKSVEFEVKLDQSVGEVATDEAIVRQIIDNFLSNAVDALEDKGGKIKVTTIRDGDRVAVEVADTGSGIPSDVMASIFDPFFSTKGPGKGYGLGLAISATLAESLSGAITVESKEGEGSRFRLWIPRRAPAE